MKFTIEVEEFWIEEEDLTDELKGHIKRSVVHQISENIKDKVESQITKKVREVIEEKVAIIIDGTLTDLVATGMITIDRKEISIQDHCKSIFKQSHGWGRPMDQLERLAKKFGEEIKLQYNAAFANKIVANMKEQGLLRDDVVQILLEGK